MSWGKNVSSHCLKEHKRWKKWPVLASKIPPRLKKSFMVKGLCRWIFQGAAFHWRLSDYAETTVSLFRIFFVSVCVLRLWPLTVNPFFLQPTAGFIQSWFSASSLEVLQLAYLNWWKIPEVLLLTNGWVVDFSCSHSISLHGWISYTHWSAENMQCVKIKHQGKDETDKHVDLLFVGYIFPGFVPTSWPEWCTWEGYDCFYELVDAIKWDRAVENSLQSWSFTAIWRGDCIWYQGNNRNKYLISQCGWIGVRWTT